MRYLAFVKRMQWLTEDFVAARISLLVEANIEKRRLKFRELVCGIVEMRVFNDIKT